MYPVEVKVQLNLKSGELHAGEEPTDAAERIVRFQLALDPDESIEAVDLVTDA